MDDDLMNLGLVDDAEIVLDEAALELALLDHEGTDLAPYEDLLSALAARLEEVGGEATTAADRTACLAQVFAGEFGFAGDRDSYDDPDNADLIRVIDRRRGLPISLSILYVAAPRRVGWTADVLNLPGHVLVMIGHEVAPVVVNSFAAACASTWRGSPRCSPRRRTASRRRCAMWRPCSTARSSFGCCSTRRPARRRPAASDAR